MDDKTREPQITYDSDGNVIWTEELEQSFENAAIEEQRWGARVKSRLLLEVAHRRLKLDFPNARDWETSTYWGREVVAGRVLFRDGRVAGFAVEVGTPSSPATPARVKREFARKAREVMDKHPDLAR